MKGGCIWFPRELHEELGSRVSELLHRIIAVMDDETGRVPFQARLCGGISAKQAMRRLKELEGEPYNLLRLDYEHGFIQIVDHHDYIHTERDEMGNPTYRTLEPEWKRPPQLVSPRTP